MSKRRIAVALAVSGLVAGAALTAGSTSASADIQPQAHDVVGVGSDVVQYAADFLADGDSLSDPGYNSADNKWRVFTFDAAADANGRGVGTDPKLGTPTSLSPTSVLRAGTSPVQRPNGGTAGIAALLGDGHVTTVNGQSQGVSANLIQFVRSPNLLNTTQQGTASTTLGSSIAAIQFADDTQYVATSAATSAHPEWATNAPAGLTAAQLADIYCSNATARATWQSAHGSSLYTWDQVSGTGTDAINAELPQDGAGVQKIFLTAIQSSSELNGSACTLSNNVVKVQQNDPSAITGATKPADTIDPIPLSRFTLLHSGYFLDPNTAYARDSNGKVSAAAQSTAGITLQIPGAPASQVSSLGVTSVGAGAFAASIPFYILFRAHDTTAFDYSGATPSPIPWQPGSTLNWIQTLFYNSDYDYSDPTNPDNPPAPFFASQAAATLLANVGLKWDYRYCGDSATSCSVTPAPQF